MTTYRIPFLILKDPIQPELKCDGYDTVLKDTMPENFDWLTLIIPHSTQDTSPKPPSTHIILTTRKLIFSSFSMIRGVTQADLFFDSNTLQTQGFDRAFSPLSCRESKCQHLSVPSYSFS